MTELKPCPFCGSEKAELITDIDDGRMVYGAWCSQCCASTGRRFAIADEAAESWNHRTERTCRVPLLDDDEEIALRESHPGTVVTQDVPMCRKCTSCGGKFRPWAELPKWLLYCPRCGAKVIE